MVLVAVVQLRPSLAWPGAHRQHTLPHSRQHAPHNHHPLSISMSIFCLAYFMYADVQFVSPARLPSAAKVSCLVNASLYFYNYFTPQVLQCLYSRHCYLKGPELPRYLSQAKCWHHGRLRIALKQLPISVNYA